MAQKYELKLAGFEGPLDLLLHLISKAKIELQDIFVSEITEQYLEYVQAAQELDMEMASDFLQMAATLIYIKSRSLLPQKRIQEDVDEEGLTPEEQLVRRLQEYKCFKEVSEELKELEANANGICYKLPEEITGQEFAVEPSFKGDAAALAAAYLKVLNRIRQRENKPEDVVIHRDGFSVRQQTKVILARLTIKSEVEFDELLSPNPDREELAVTFLSLLELLHQSRISVRQSKVFATIHIRKKDASGAA